VLLCLLEVEDMTLVLCLFRVYPQDLTYVLRSVQVCHITLQGSLLLSLSADNQVSLPVLYSCMRVSGIKSRAMSNPKPQTLNPKPQTLNPKPQTLNPNLQSLDQLRVHDIKSGRMPNPKPQTLNPNLQSFDQLRVHDIKSGRMPNPKPQTLNPNLQSFDQLRVHDIKSRRMLNASELKGSIRQCCCFWSGAICTVLDDR
jgi:hypothetical protein